MTDRMRLRDADLTDLPGIVDIYNASIPGRLATADTEPITVESRQEWFARFSPDRRPLWVVEEGDILCGWLAFGWFYGGRPAYDATAEISVYVAPGKQRKGVGRFLVTEAVRRAPTLGIRTLLYFVFAHNEPSLRLCRAFGFSEWGYLPAIACLDGVERDLAIYGLRLRDPATE
ncbi:MAG: GNAT family N-acetyltransferase [Capsulimonadales bacterium]|nr:GNAT family N-acetyltransferase [Capsulimonadales bacterium]